MINKLNKTITTKTNAPMINRTASDKANTL